MLTIRDRATVDTWGPTECNARTANYIGPGDYEFLDEWRPAIDGASWLAGTTGFIRFAADIPTISAERSVYLTVA